MAVRQPGYNGTACGCGRSTERTVVMGCASRMLFLFGRQSRPLRKTLISGPALRNSVETSLCVYRTTSVCSRLQQFERRCRLAWERACPAIVLLIAQPLSRGKPARSQHLQPRQRSAYPNSWVHRSRLEANRIGKNRCSSSLRVTRPTWVLTFNAASTWPEAS